MVEIVVEWGPLSIFFLIYTIRALMKKFDIDFIISRVLFWVAQPKQKKIPFYIPCMQFFFGFFFKLYLSKLFLFQFFFNIFFH